MKKFYSLVSTEENKSGFSVLLDGRLIKTPGRLDMIAPTQALADAIMREWMGQGDVIIPDTMPLTQILSTKIDRVCLERPAMMGYLMKYVDTDMVCYFTDTPSELAAAQETAWRPVLNWIEARYGTALQETTALQALSQDENLKRAIQRDIEDMDDDHFAALQLGASLAGSVALGLMLVHGAMDAGDAFHAMRVEERYHAQIANEDLHGPDPAQAEKDALILKDLTAVEKYVLCLAMKIGDVNE